MVKKLVALSLASAFFLPIVPAYANDFMPRSQEAARAEQDAANKAYIADMKEIADKRPSALSPADFAMRAYSLGETALAREYAEKALDGTDSKNRSVRTLANFVLSLSSLDSGSTDEAVKYAESVVSANADDWRGYYALALVHEKIGKDVGDSDIIGLSIHNYLEAAAHTGEHPSFYVGRRLSALSEGRNLVLLVGRRDARRVLDVTKWEDGNYLGDYLDSQEIENEREARRWCLKHRPGLVVDTSITLY